MHSYTSYVVLCVRVFCPIDDVEPRFHQSHSSFIENTLSSNGTVLDCVVCFICALSFIRLLRSFSLFLVFAHGSIALNEMERVIAAIPLKKPWAQCARPFVRPKNVLCASSFAGVSSSLGDLWLSDRQMIELNTLIVSSVWWRGGVVAYGFATMQVQVSNCSAKIAWCIFRRNRPSLLAALVCHVILQSNQLIAIYYGSSAIIIHSGVRHPNVYAFSTPNQRCSFWPAVDRPYWFLCKRIHMTSVLNCWWCMLCAHRPFSIIEFATVEQCLDFTCSIVSALVEIALCVFDQNSSSSDLMRALCSMFCALHHTVITKPNLNKIITFSVSVFHRLHVVWFEFWHVFLHHSLMALPFCIHFVEILGFSSTSNDAFRPKIKFTNENIETFFSDRAFVHVMLNAFHSSCV